MYRRNENGHISFGLRQLLYHLIRPTSMQSMLKCRPTSDAVNQSAAHENLLEQYFSPGKHMATFWCTYKFIRPQNKVYRANITMPRHSAREQICYVGKRCTCIKRYHALIKGKIRRILFKRFSQFFATVVH